LKKPENFTTERNEGRWTLKHVSIVEELVVELEIDTLAIPDTTLSRSELNGSVQRGSKKIERCKAGF